MNEQKLTNHFKTGVVSWSLFSDFWDKQHDFIKKINHLLGTSEEEGGWGISIAFDLIEVAQKEIEEYWETAKKETADAGGNDVYAISANEYSQLLQSKIAFLERQRAAENAEVGRSHVSEQ